MIPAYLRVLRLEGLILNFPMFHKDHPHGVYGWTAWQRPRTNHYHHHQHHHHHNNNNCHRMLPMCQSLCWECYAYLSQFILTVNPSSTYSSLCITHENIEAQRDWGLAQGTQLGRSKIGIWIQARQTAKLVSLPCHQTGFLFVCFNLKKKLR